MVDLKFSIPRKANLARLPLFKNKKGKKAHSKKDGSDWSLSDWSNAVTGELGEAANIIKKIRRGDLSLAEARVDLAKELADVQIYLDILAFRAGVDLGQATVNKFNEVSDRVGAPVYLEEFLGGLDVVVGKVPIKYAALQTANLRGEALIQTAMAALNGKRYMKKVKRVA